MMPDASCQRCHRYFGDDTRHCFHYIAGDTIIATPRDYAAVAIAEAAADTCQDKLIDLR